MRGYLGNQGRNNNNRPNKGPRHGGGNRDGNRDPNRGNVGGRMDEHLPDLDPIGEDDAEVISPAELAASRNSMNLTALKAKPIHELVKQAESMGLESLARSRKRCIYDRSLASPLTSVAARIPAARSQKRSKKTGPK